MTARERALQRGGAGWIRVVVAQNVAEAQTPTRRRRPTQVLPAAPALPISWWTLQRKQRDARGAT